MDIGFIWDEDKYQEVQKKQPSPSFMRTFPHLTIQTDTKPWIQRDMKIGGFGKE